MSQQTVQEYQATLSFISDEKPSTNGDGTYHMVKVNKVQGMSPEVATALGMNPKYSEFLAFATAEQVGWYQSRIGTEIIVTFPGSGKFDVDFSRNADVPVAQVQPPPTQPPPQPAQPSPNPSPQQPSPPPDPSTAKRAGRMALHVDSRMLVDAEIRMRNHLKVYDMAWGMAEAFLADKVTGDEEIFVSDIRPLATSIYLESPLYRLEQTPVDLSGEHQDYGKLWAPRPAQLVLQEILNGVDEDKEFTPAQAEGIRKAFLGAFTKMGTDEDRKKFCTIVFGVGSSKKLTTAQQMSAWLWTGATKTTGYKVAIPARYEYEEVLKYEPSS